MRGVLLNPSEAISALRSVENALLAESELSARALSSRTGWSPEVCDQVLYGNQDRFYGSGSPVRWRIRRSGPAAPKAAPKRDAQGKQKLKRSEATESWQPLSGGDRLPTMASLKLYPWQKEALAAWREAGRSGIVTAVTGAGKTRVALGAIREQLGRRGRVVIVVPTTALQRQWFDELTAIFPGRSIGRLGGGHRQTLRDAQILVTVAASGRQYSFDVPQDANCLLIADECHRYASGSNRKVLDDRCNTRLGLTATLERGDGLHAEVLVPYFGGVVYHLGYREALEAKVIAPFRVAAIGAAFTTKEAKRYEELSEEMRNLRTQLLNRWGVTAEPFSIFLADIDRLIDTGPRSAGMTASAWRKRWVQRRDLLGESRAKQDLVLKIQRAYEDADRSIVFCSTIDSAKQVGACLRERGIAAAVHTSATNDAERSRILDVFSDGKIKVLVTVQTLDEGVDVPEADLAVILGSTSTKRQMVQRMGRVIRKKPDRRFARFAYTYIEGTVEDPANGAHESFMEEMFEVADEMVTFSTPIKIGEVRRFLQPKRRKSSPLPQTAQIESAAE